MSDETRCRAERYDRYRYPLLEEVVSCELAAPTQDRLRRVPPA
ncbi:hypothetical protein OG711_18250 [Streptomyces uncialis]|nr:hypothetical protein [Streptomyces uncialis]